VRRHPARHRGLMTDPAAVNTQASAVLSGENEPSHG
jgi:hypothetical protein